MIQDTDQDILQNSEFLNKYYLDIRSAAGKFAYNFYSRNLEKHIELSKEPAFENPDFQSNIQVIFLYADEDKIKGPNVPSKAFQVPVFLFGYSEEGVEKTKRMFFELVQELYELEKPLHLII